MSQLLTYEMLYILDQAFSDQEKKDEGLIYLLRCLLLLFDNL